MTGQPYLLTSASVLRYPLINDSSILASKRLVHSYMCLQVPAPKPMVQLFFSLAYSTLIMAKGWVALLKKTTLQKLELMAAVIAAKLAKFVVNSLGLDTPVHFWTNSQSVLFWLRSTKSLPQIISPKVSEIQQLIPSATWRHCLTADSHADLLTRGLNFEQFSTSSVWWHGPMWLKDPQKWPTWDVQSVSQLYAVRCSATHSAATLTCTKSSHWTTTVPLIGSWHWWNMITLCWQLQEHTNQELRATAAFRSDNSHFQWVADVQQQCLSQEIKNVKSHSPRFPLVRHSIVPWWKRPYTHVPCGGRIHNAHHCWTGQISIPLANQTCPHFTGDLEGPWEPNASWSKCNHDSSASDVLDPSWKTKN